MEQVKIEVDEELLLALQKIHECQTIYFSAMAKYDDAKTLEDFGTHCDCITHIIKEQIGNGINCRMEDVVNEEYDKKKTD